MTIERAEYHNCGTLTSDRDPRVIVHINVTTPTGNGSVGTTHTFWSREIAERFVAEVAGSHANSSAYNVAYAVADTYVNATAERLTSAEIAWLCTPTSETPKDWMTQPRTMPNA